MDWIVHISPDNFFGHTGLAGWHTKHTFAQTFQSEIETTFRPVHFYDHNTDRLSAYISEQNKKFSIFIK